MDTKIRSSAVDFGAHGTRQTTTNDGHVDSKKWTEHAADGFGGPGTKQGLASPAIPAANRAGAFEMDASLNSYTGRDGDAGGPTQDFKKGNHVPDISCRNEGAL